MTAYRSKHPGLEVDEIDLWQANLPEFNSDSAATIHTAAIYMFELPKAYGTDYMTSYLVDWFKFTGVAEVTSLWYSGSKMRNEDGSKIVYQEAVTRVRAAALRKPPTCQSRPAYH